MNNCKKKIKGIISFLLRIMCGKTRTPPLKNMSPEQPRMSIHHYNMIHWLQMWQWKGVFFFFFPNEILFIQKCIGKRPLTNM